MLVSVCAVKPTLARFGAERPCAADVVREALGADSPRRLADSPRRLELAARYVALVGRPPAPRALTQLPATPAGAARALAARADRHHPVGAGGAQRPERQQINNQQHQKLPSKADMYIVYVIKMYY